MIEYAKRQLPTYKHASVPIYVKATAGVRILNEAKRVAVVKALTNYLSDSSKSPFQFDKNLGVQVLSGEFEGAFDWLTVNYLAGTLGKDSVELSQISIDMGGSSLELTFEPTGELMEGAFPLRFNGTDVILYTHSYLKFGRNQALVRHRQALLEAFPDDKMVKDPCFPVGFREVIELNERTVEVSGTGDYELCQLLTRKLLRESKFCPSEPCAMNGVYQPDLPHGRPIVAIDSFAKLAEILGCPKVSNLECLEQNAILECQSSARPTESHAHKGLLASKCFLAAYGTNVLRHGFRVGPLHPILFTDEDYDGTMAVK
ncbi:Ectonucleoside triphosphate diphosphohydrolase 1 [Massospora cicadina]|nr:Ectonucleoside triphosphate diphosphohydrolase 1 [Massospora cicadina]